MLDPMKSDGIEFFMLYILWNWLWFITANSVNHFLILFTRLQMRQKQSQNKSNMSCDHGKREIGKSQRIHYTDVTLSIMASQITSNSMVYSTILSWHQRNHQSLGNRPFVRGIQRWAVASPRKGPVTWKAFPLRDFIMLWRLGAGHIVYFIIPTASAKLKGGYT